MSPAGIDPDTPRYTWADLLTSWEVGRSFGHEEGVRCYAGAVEWMVAQALSRPEGHGGPDLDETARSTARALFARYLLIKGDPAT